MQPHKMHYLPPADPTSLSETKALLWLGGFQTVTKPAESCFRETGEICPFHLGLRSTLKSSLIHIVKDL